MAKIIDLSQAFRPTVSSIPTDIQQHAAHLQFRHEDVLDATKTDQELYDLAIAFSYQDYDTDIDDSEHRLVAEEVVRLYKPTE